MKGLPALPLLGVTAPSAAMAQQLGGGGPADVSMIRVVIALIVCLVLAALAILLIRQRIGGAKLSLLPRLTGGSDRIRVVETRRISAQADLTLVEVDQREYLLLLNSGKSLVLAERAVARERQD